MVTWNRQLNQGHTVGHLGAGGRGGWKRHKLATEDPFPPFPDCRSQLVKPVSFSQARLSLCLSPWHLRKRRPYRFQTPPIPLGRLNGMGDGDYSQPWSKKMTVKCRNSVLASINNSDPKLVLSPKLGPNPNNAPWTWTPNLIFSESNHSHSDAFTGLRSDLSPSSKPNTAQNTTVIQILLPKVSSFSDSPLTLGIYILR